MGRRWSALPDMTRPVSTRRRRSAGRLLPARLACVRSPDFRPVLAAIVMGTACASPSTAQSNRTDEQIWTSLSGTVPAGPSAEVRVDGLVQFVDGASRPGRELLRVVALKPVGGRLKVGAGYVWTAISPRRGFDVTEHRAVQEIDYLRPVLGGRAHFASRSQLEERWREGDGGMSLRLRQRVRLQAPTGRAGTDLVAWTEYFHEFRETAWSGRAGPGLIISFAGVRLPLTNTIAIEPGYLNQTEFNPGPNRVRHAAALFASVRF